MVLDPCLDHITNSAVHFIHDPESMLPLGIRILELFDRLSPDEITDIRPIPVFSIYDPLRFARTIFRSGRERLLPYIRPFDRDLMPLALMECSPACPYQSIDLNTAHCQVFHESGL